MHNQKLDGLKKEHIGVFRKHECEFIYEIYSGKNKDYYLNIETDALGQKF